MRRAPLAMAAAVAALSCAATVPAAAAAGYSAGVSFDSGRPGAPVPADFLGLSFEVKSLPVIGTYADRGNLASLLRSLGPGVLRFGGVTADTQVAWTGDGGALPDWARIGLGAGDFDGVARLAGETGWHVLLTLNLGHYDPPAAAAEAAAAHAALGSSLAGLAFGNEPDAFAHSQLRPDPWGFSPYQAQLWDYRTALGPGEGLVALAGPDVASGRARLAWLQAEADDVAPDLLTVHYYPLSWCAGFVPGIPDLLSRGVKGAENRELARMAAISAASGIPLRVDETNDISCGGEPGVSNAFASALWATDFLARAMAAGVAGVNFHTSVANPLGYSPIAADMPDALATGQLTAHPEWYALLLAQQLLGDRPLPTTVHAGGSGLSAQAFLSPGGAVRVVLVNERGAGPARSVALTVLHGLAAATVLRLTAPSAGATSGVQLGGASVTPDGTWSPAPPGPLIPARSGTLPVAMSAASAALVTIYPRR